MSGTRKSAAERREEASSASRERSLSNLRPWKPGQSGNPRGRTPGIAAAVRDELGELGGEAYIVRRLLAELQKPHLKTLEVVAVCKELADRGYGKSPAYAAIEGGDPLELESILGEIQGIADELRARRDARQG
jgi:hypothetical protein